ncbi:hypothetical protein D3C76_1313730 [compost metagenome]
MVTGRSLAGEDLHPRYPVGAGVVAYGLIKRHGVQQVEQLALVLVDALDLHIEQRFGVHRDTNAVLDDAGQRALAVQALSSELLAETRLIGKGHKASQKPFRVVLEPRPERFDQHLGQLWV